MTTSNTEEVANKLAGIQKRCEICLYMSGTAHTTKECHRFPPKGQISTGVAVWTRVRKEDWCGEFRLDPEKLRKVSE